MVRRRLRAVITVPFNKSEETNFDEVLNSKKYGPLIKTMSHGDVICFLATGLNQLYFVHGYTKVSTKGERPWMALFSQKMRIKRLSGFSNEFEPLMLANYALSCGIELIGIKLFEEHLKRLAA